MTTDFLPADGISQEWLKAVYREHVFRSKARGKDGVRQNRFAAQLDQEVEHICDRVTANSYKFTRYREILISRGPDRVPRQISVPTIRDRLTLRATLEHLKHAFPAAIAAPPHRYIKDIKAHLKACREHSSFLRMDIRNFFPSIQHQKLIDVLSNSDLDKRFIHVLSAAITTPTGNETAAPSIGVPQGLSVSNMLASIYLQKFDLQIKGDLFYRRYVDDILVIAPSEKISEAYIALFESLRELGLVSHPIGTIGKTETAKVSDGIQYLGYQIASQSVSVRKDSLARMFTNLAKVITSLKRGRDTEKHLYRLNLKVTGCVLNNARRGWLMFFSQTENMSQLAFLDQWLRKQISVVEGISYSDVKSFKRSYYQVRYNLKKTSYIPNFDQYTMEQKSEVIRILSNRTAEQVSAMDIEAIEAEFARLVGREITELEKDLMQAFS